ncbi:MAG: DUF4169 family protein [Magnetovibrio sp.]|nr:DUF4169 family protein [Magnetovibrio sp.]
MVDVVSLNQFRKAKTRSDKATKAENNRIKFGRSKAEKAKDAKDLAAQKRALDGKQIVDKTDP